MPRPKQFDPDHALEMAMHVFWRQGYKATSIEDLAGAMGINRFSLYDTFGDKQALYLQVLEKYRRMIAVELLAVLADDDGLAAIKAYFARLGEALSSDIGRQGCLMQNATVECALGDIEIASRTHAFNEDLQDLFYRALKRARTAGDLPGGSNLRDRARVLFALAQGMMVMAKDAPAQPTGARGSLTGTARWIAREIEAWRVDASAA